MDFSVFNPRKSSDGNHIVYTVVGIDRLGRFDICRRYKEFNVLRQTLRERFIGMYVPPIPPKRRNISKNTNDESIESRCFFLNMFIKQLVRCPYLLESEEFQIFTRPPNLTEVDKTLTYLPKLNFRKMLEKITPFYSIMGDISLDQL